MILIIDDDSAVRSSLSFMLKRAGYEAQTVPGPREAMEVVRSVAPDLILMDMNFTLSTTGEEGLTLLKQVKIFRPEVPVILMTAWGSIQLAVQGMQAEPLISLRSHGIMPPCYNASKRHSNFPPLHRRQPRNRASLSTAATSSGVARD